jgi:hypothetical protein
MRGVLKMKIELEIGDWNADRITSEVVKTAIAALREKQTRESGCEHCRGWDKRCGANYCPMCGKRLEVKHNGT